MVDAAGSAGSAGSDGSAALATVAAAAAGTAAPVAPVAPAERGAPRVDGRSARAERTRRAIVEAHLALIEGGDLKPTGARIAARAGVSLRALWTNFKDMDSLFAATFQRLQDRQLALFEPVSTDLPLRQRVEAFCRQRAEMLELIGPSARAAALLEPFSAQLQRNRVFEINRVRDEVEILFAGELGSAGGAREDLARALAASTTFSFWAVLRDQFDLDTDHACRVMVRTVTALLVAAISADADGERQF